MYLEYLGLREKPFSITADPSFLYLSRKHREALSHMVYGIRERKGFVEITGEIGTGKTTLCKALLRQLDPSTKTALILQPALSELEQLRQRIGVRYHITPLDRDEVRTYIDHRLRVAGSDGALEWTPEGAEEVYLCSKGMRRREPR